MKPWKKRTASQENQQPNETKRNEKQRQQKKRNLLAAGCSFVLLAVILTAALCFTPKQSIPVEDTLAPSGLPLLSSKSDSDDSSSQSSSQTAPSGSGERPSASESISSEVSSEKNPSQPQECAHTFIDETVMPNCKAQGYTTHTCLKCGYQYTDSYTAPQHDYGKYLCDFCGAPDPSNPYYSLSAWINRSVSSRDELGNPNWTYTSPDASYCITSCENMAWLLIRYSRQSANGEFEDLLLELNSRNQECHVSYTRCTAAGDYQNGTAIVDRSEVRSPATLASALSTGQGSESYPVEAFRADCSNRIEDVMNTVENQMLAPRLGFHVDMLGLTK